MTHELWAIVDRTGAPIRRSVNRGTTVCVYATERIAQTAVRHYTRKHPGGVRVVRYAPADTL